MDTHGLSSEESAFARSAPLPEGVAALRVELRDRRITDVTPDLCALLDDEAEAIVGRPLGSLWLAAERSAIRARFDDVVLLGGDSFGALALDLTGQAITHVDVDARFEYLGGQRLDILLTPTARAVSDRRPAVPDRHVDDAERPRDDSRGTELLGVLHAAGHAALLVDDSGLVSGATPGIDALFPVPAEALDAQPLEALFELSDPAEEALASARESGERQTVRASPEGVSLPLLLEWIPGLAPDSGVALLTPVVDDGPSAETERLKFQSQLVSHVAHDLRDTSASVYCGLRTLVDSLQDGSDELETAEAALVESKRVNQIIDEVLAVSRPGRLRRVELDLNHVLTETLDRYEARAAEIGVDIARDLGPGVRISVDRSSLERAYGNLIDNALHAMQDGGTLSVGTELEERVGNGILVSIADTGGGMAADFQASVFEPFVTNKEGGSGLGLAITRRVVLDHGGQIDFESEEGVGTTFRIWLPRI